MLYVGCDLHKHSTYFYVIDNKGKRILNQSIPNDAALLHKFFRSLPGPFTLAVEATYNWYFFIDIVKMYTDHYYLANPLSLKAFAKQNKKGSGLIRAYELSSLVAP